MLFNWSRSSGAVPFDQSTILGAGHKNTVKNVSDGSHGDITKCLKVISFFAVDICAAHSKNLHVLGTASAEFCFVLPGSREYLIWVYFSVPNH